MTKTKDPPVPAVVPVPQVPDLPSPDILAPLVIQGDLGVLKKEQKVQYYVALCQTLGLNPATQPFRFLELNGKEVLYAQKGCTDQLRKLYGISVEITSRQVVGDVYSVTAKAIQRATGRTDEAIGAVNFKTVYRQGKGMVEAGPDDVANAMMKAETKAKRRVTLSICGLGFMDESEIETVRGAQKISMDQAVGNLMEEITDQEWEDFIKETGQDPVTAEDLFPDVDHITRFQLNQVKKNIQYPKEKTS